MKFRYYWLPVFICILALTNAYAQEVTALGPNTAITREIKPDQRHAYQVQLKTGQFFAISVEQPDVDMMVSVTAPNGELRIDRTFFPVGETETMAGTAVTTGTHRIVVRPQNQVGKYTIRIEVKDAPTADEAKRAQADQLLNDAILLVRQGTSLRPFGVNPSAEVLQRSLALFNQAIEKQTQALAIWRELGDQIWEGITLVQLGQATPKREQFEQKIAYYQQALAIWQANKSGWREIAALSNLASTIFTVSFGATVVILENDSLAEAQSLSQRAIPLLEQLYLRYQEKNYPAGEVFALMRLGEASLYAFPDHVEKQQDYFSRALTISRSLKDSENQRLALHRLGITYARRGKPEEALTHFEEAVTVARSANNLFAESNMLDAVAQVWGELSRYEKVVECRERKLQITRLRKDRRNEAVALNSLGIAYTSLSNYAKAIEYYEAALAIDKELSTGGMTPLMNLGHAARNLKAYEKALDYYQQALVQERTSSNPGNLENTALNSIATIYGLMGNHAKQLATYEDSLSVAQKKNDPTEQSTAILRMARFYLEQKQYEKALDYNMRAITLRRQERYYPDEALDLLSQIYYDLGRYSEAFFQKHQLLQNNRARKQRAGEARTLATLMNWAHQQNQPTLAILYGKQAVNIYQDIRSDIRNLDRQSQQTYTQSKERTYRQLADLLISLGRLPEAEQVIRMLKEEEYYEYVRRDDNNAPTTDKTAMTPEEAALEKRFREIADSLIEIGEQRSTLIAKPTRSTEENALLTRLENDLSVANQKFQRFLDNLSSELSAKANAQQKVYQIRESQGLMEDLRELGKGVAALYTLVGEEKFRVILTNADVQKAYEFPIKGADLNRKVLAFRDALQNKQTDPRPAAQELYQILLGPVAKDLQKMKATTLMWSLDGVLRYVPIAALHDGEKYLVERYNNIVFTPASNARLKDAPRAKWEALGLGVTRGFENVPPLPAVAEEMRSIIKDAATPNANGILPGTIKLDDQFTQEAMLTALRARPAVVHVASHFQFKPGNETNSALLLGDGKFLSLAQIKSMPNVFGGVELLTLSACNTATGSSTANGKEVEGFGVLAQRQGAKAVVASLWPVDDRTTRLLMEEFYRGRETSKLSKGEALRQAQIKLLRGELNRTKKATEPSREIVHEAATPTLSKDAKRPFQHPYYWAPFIMIGNWR